jgi:hypothetical protein
MIYVAIITIDKKKTFAVVEAEDIEDAIEILALQRCIQVKNIHSIEEYDEVAHSGVIDHTFKSAMQTEDIPF